MSRFLDLRYAPVGGDLTTQVNVNEATSSASYMSLTIQQMQAGIRGRHVLIATHGFNVNRANGIASLANWERLLQLPPSSAFLGLLWPGDSIWAHGLDYPEEPKVADNAGKLLAPFIDANLQDAASLSFASHSLGARVVLATIKNLKRRVRRLTLMAGAVDDNCLTGEFADAAASVDRISILASKKDTVLSRLFPIGNFFAGIIDAGHPWWHAAVGHNGPAKTWPSNFQPPFEIPDEWDFNHGSYLQIDATAPGVAVPYEIPPQGTPPLANGATGWQEAFSAAFESTRFR